MVGIGVFQGPEHPRDLQHDAAGPAFSLGRRGQGRLGGHVIRSRPVVDEARGLSLADTFSATPPHEALRMFLLLSMSHPNVVVGIWDVSRAQLHSAVRRNMLLRWSKGLEQVGSERATQEPGQLVRLTRWSYGLRDASRSFDSHRGGILKDLGFAVGAHCPA